jgi:hypothetical protein
MVYLRSLGSNNHQIYTTSKLRREKRDLAFEDKRASSSIHFIAMNTNESKIPKPYTAYTIYWRLERMRILQEKGVIDDKTKASFDPNHYDPLEHPIPSKYKGVTLPPYWYSSLHQKELEKKRKHRKQEGSISKSALTAMISKGWSEIDPETKQYCEKLAEAEKLKRKQAIKSELNRAVAHTQPVTKPRFQLPLRCKQHEHLALRPSSVTKSSNTAISKQESCIRSRRAKPASTEARSKERVSTNTSFLPDSVGSCAAVSKSIDAEIYASLNDANLELFSDSGTDDDFQFDFSNVAFGEE